MKYTRKQLYVNYGYFLYIEQKNFEIESCLERLSKSVAILWHKFTPKFGTAYIHTVGKQYRQNRYFGTEYLEISL